MPPPIWRQIQKQNFNKLDQLATFLEIDRSLLGSNSSFSLNLPVRLAEKIAKGTINDPLLRQFVPTQEENLVSIGYTPDPVSDTSFCKSDRLLQKYSGRALLITSGACAMHCRYCFRQNFPYPQKKLFDEELSMIREDETLQEVILSGGDPLSLSDDLLGALLSSLDAVPHIKLIRFHTRFPMGIPERITAQFLDSLKKCDSQVVFVIHANHPREFDPDVLDALRMIQRLGIPVLLQAILLKGVNSDLPTLKALFETCAYNGVIPYYLHQLDKVEGSSHFEVSDERGRELIQELRRVLPGYAVPRFVREVAGHLSKTPV